MYIYNTTFMIERSESDNFLAWMRLEALPSLVGEDSPAKAPRLTCVAEVPGDSEFAAQAASFAFQTEFDTLEEARGWASTRLADAVGRFKAQFGDDRALTFATILEEIPL